MADLKEKTTVEYEKEISELKSQIKALTNSNSSLSFELKQLEEHTKELTEEYNLINSLYCEILSSPFWRITKPFRIVCNVIKSALRKYPVTLYPCKALKILLTAGPAAFARETKHFFTSRMYTDYSKISSSCRKQEEAAVFDRDIKFSILVPLYNTPIKYLREMIDSVVDQTYKNWELCLADGSDDEHSNVREFVEKRAKNDSRIVYKKLEKNLGISENTNECIKMATGDYIALFDHDDVLHPSALFENMKAICEHDADFIYTDEATFIGDNIKEIAVFHFKPDYAIDNLRSVNYICHFSTFSRELLEAVGMFRSEYDGSQDHDMVLRLTAKAKKVFHIRKLLYFWRSHPASVAQSLSSKTYAIDAGKRAVKESIRESGYDCVVESSAVLPTIYRIKYELKIHPLVSIVIPNMNHLSDLKRCVNSILRKTSYDNYEIIIIENNSTDSKLFDYYKELEKSNNIKVVTYKGKFNYSDINNTGVKAASGEYLILLNNDTEVISENWIEEMLMYGQRDDVGAVGAKLYYPDDTIQHAGVIVGLGGIAGHTHCKKEKHAEGYMGKLHFAQDLSAVTAACIMIKKEVFDRIGGLDCDFAVAFNDVDLCVRIREQGLLIVFTPYAELYHHESKSRGYEDTPEKQKRFEGEIKLFKKKWGDKILKDGDPYYNPNFSLQEDYKILYGKINADKRKKQ